MASLFRNLTDRFTNPKDREPAPEIITPPRPSTSTSGSASLLSYDDSHLAPFAPLSASSTYSSSLGEAHIRTPSISTASRTSEPVTAPVGKGPFGLTCLSSPSAPVEFDIIFVHGLGGDSFKTWCVNKRPDTYWPKEWLPHEPGFENVRTWSWGYSSFLAGGEENILNIHHLGKGLLTALNDHPLLRAEATKVIAVGHSMGGLVIKKAYNLADVDPLYKPLASRIRAITFLATPHHGADGASLLANLFSALGHDRHYIKDLSRNSGAIQEISEIFRHHAPKLHLTSFYETRKSKVKAGKVMIVDEHSAKLGYPSEKTVPLDADHRGVCKFSNGSDPNYALVRNHLAFTMNQISTGDGVQAIVVSPEEAAKELLRKQEDVRTWLGVGTTGDHDHIHARDARLTGSCEWIAEKPIFQSWRDESDCRFLWLNAKPGSGKTILAGYAIDHIRKLEQPCAHWYFKFGDHKKSSLGRCLKSLLYQMAKLDEEILEIVSGMKEQGVGLGVNDVDVRQFLLYLRQFDVLSTFKGYWVIDALDECSDIFPLLETLRSVADALSVRILFTSRMTRDLRTAFAKLSAVGNISIEPEDTAPDLRKMVRFYLEPLDILEFSDDPDEEEDPLVAEIIATSKGSLLWASLVLNEAQDCDTIKELRSVLESVPDTMDAFYERSLTMMSKNRRRIPLLKALLRWACCAHTPLTLPELKQALKIELDDDFVKLKELIETNCGQLVTIDASGGLNVIHKSAGDYLMSGKETSELCVDVREAHAQMARVCLGYLVGEEMKPPRSTEGRDLGRVIDKRSVFHTYASMAFSYHVSMADPSNFELLALLEKFLAANVLSWIEASAAIFGLHKVNDAGIHLDRYVRNYQEFDLSVVERHDKLQSWTTDLSRLVGNFGHVLTDSPSSIYGLVPPITPSTSMIHNISPQTRTLSVLGYKTPAWDDRLLSMGMGQTRPNMKKTWDRTWEEATSQIMDYYPEAPLSLAYGNSYVAISVPTEDADLVRMYDAVSYELKHQIDHGEIVVALQFDNSTGYLAVAGLTTVRIVNVPRKQDMYLLNVPECPMCLGFLGSELRVVGEDQMVYSWRLDDEVEVLPSLEHTDLFEPDAQKPLTGCISMAHNLMSLAYPDSRVETWDLKEDILISTIDVTLSRGHGVLALEFQPNPDRQPLIICMGDNQMMALLDPFASKVVKAGSNRCHTMAVSPDGRFIAVGHDVGIALHDFSTFTLLYSISIKNEPSHQLRFSPDSRRIGDTRGTTFVLWEPPILAHKDPVRTILEGGQPSRTMHQADVRVIMAAHPTEDSVFISRNDGQVLAYSRKLPYTPQVLYKYDRHEVIKIKWCDMHEALLTYTEVSLIIKSVQRTATGWEVGASRDVERNIRGTHIRDALVSNGSDQYAIVSRDKDYLCDLKSGSCQEFSYQRHSVGAARDLAHHPTSLDHAISMDLTEVRIHLWADWSIALTITLPGTSYPIDTWLNIATVCQSRNGWVLLDNSSGSFRNEQHRSVLCWQDEASRSQSTSSQLDSSTMKLKHSLPHLDAMFKQAIGVISLSRLVFLSKASWICSIDLDEASLRSDQGALSLEYKKHFYVPSDWLQPADYFDGRYVVCTMSQGDMIFACLDGLTVVRNFMEHSETASFRSSS